MKKYYGVLIIVLVFLSTCSRVVVVLNDANALKKVVYDVIEYS